MQKSRLPGQRRDKVDAKATHKEARCCGLVALLNLQRVIGPGGEERLRLSPSIPATSHISGRQGASGRGAEHSGDMRKKGGTRIAEGYLERGRNQESGGIGGERGDKESVAGFPHIGQFFLTSSRHSARVRLTKVPLGPQTASRLPSVKANGPGRRLLS